VREEGLVKPSNQPRLKPNGGSSLKPAWFVVAVPATFATVIFPPIGVVLLAILAAVGLSKLLGVRSVRKAERDHRRRMDAFYQSQEDARREAYYAQRTFVNPGWQV
jgi:hypothetical protein